jgi:putative PIN family toxin of toxin-antitoxin system
MRVVIDTNILVSFAIRHNANFERLFDRIAEHGVSLICNDTILELFTVLNRDKFRRYISPVMIVDYVEWYSAISERVITVEPITACRDPADDKFLALAVSGNADCIIAGDKDLLDMTEFRGIPIYRVTDFLQHLDEKN